MRRVLCLLTAVLAVAACTPTPKAPVKPADPIPAPKFLNVMTASACALQCKPNTEIDAWATKFVQQIDKLEIDVFMMQQMCKSQYLGLEKQLARRADGRGAYSLIWHSTLENSTDCPKWGKTENAADAKHYGLMIAVRGVGTLNNGNHVDLPVGDKKEPRALFCGDARVSSLTARVCTVNMDLAPKLAESQVLKAAEFLNEYARERPVIVGGNFNMRPTHEAILQLYGQPHGKGQFEEVDYADKRFYGTRCPGSAPRCVSGVVTTEKAKVDYLFMSDNHFDVVGGGVEPEVFPEAQHIPLVANLLPSGAS